MKNIKHVYFLSTLFHIYFFLHHTISISAISTPAYTPTDNITLDCGSSANSTAQDGRIWSSDMGSKFGPSEQSNNITSVMRAASNLSPSAEHVPYKTARISLSQFTYTFPVAEAGPKFIRLYFYPASYPGFETSKAFFSVKAGRYTLLSNFTADSSDSKPFFKEFCINVIQNQQLNITFASSTTSSDADVYAFINGIEIVSMPPNLYYTPSGDEGIPFLGQRYQFDIDNSYALEMVYRLNVGGSFISPEKDSGMYRTWYDEDDEYLLNNKVGVLPTNTSTKIQYTQKTPAYTAPKEVYLTARSMGWNKIENLGYNLTWGLPVDLGFNYLVRLHFCEFQREITRTADRVFYIYINNQTAEEMADVIYWSGGNGFPVHKDYVVTMEGQGIKGKRDLFIALHPRTESSTGYSDAILNGVEMFKISNPYGNLGVPNPEPQVSPPPVGPSSSIGKKSKPSKIVFIAISGSVMVVLAILSVLCCTICRRRRKAKDHGSYCGLSRWLWWDPYKAMSFMKRPSSLPEELCRHFSLAEIRTATNDFDDTSIIGAGGFGNVYKGYIDGGNTVVAIKRLNPESRQGAHEFKTEIKMLSQLRYLHLVSLIGYCNDGREMILVYDYMINGTLRDHLYETKNEPLPWKQRLEICIGAAKGLHYLHTGVKQTIIHRDVKSTNILLDEKWVPKVSDFGLSKMGPSNMSNTAVSTLVKGTWGYLDPEYIMRQQLTEKSDVYSFGVVLFEVLCARKAVNSKLSEDQVNLADWVKICVRNRTLDKIIDPFLIGNIAPICLKTFVAIAQNCLQDNGIERPTMGDVVGSLEFALQLQNSAEVGMEKISFDCMDQYMYEEIAFNYTAINSARKDVAPSQGGGMLDSSTSRYTMSTSIAGLSCPTIDSDSEKSETSLRHHESDWATKSEIIQQIQ